MSIRSPDGPVTVEWVQAGLALIASEMHDYESAHSEEDKLYRILLEHIASGNVVDAAGCAAWALKSQDLAFDRWCA